MSNGVARFIKVNIDDKGSQQLLSYSQLQAVAFQGGEAIWVKAAGYEVLLDMIGGDILQILQLCRVPCESLDT